METDSIYSREKNIFRFKRISLDIYEMKAGTVEEKHYHDGLEIVYVIDGWCKTHQKGRWYFYKKGQEHEVINDSDRELVVMCLTIPPESSENTHYI